MDGWMDGQNFHSIHRTLRFAVNTEIYKFAAYSLIETLAVVVNAPCYHLMESRGVMLLMRVHEVDNR